MNRNLNLRFAIPMATLAAFLSVPLASFAQAGVTKSKHLKNVDTAPAANSDPAHNLSGMYEFFVKGIPDQGLYGSPSAKPPDMTPWAQIRYDAAKPGYGPKATVQSN